MEQILTQAIYFKTFWLWLAMKMPVKGFLNYGFGHKNKLSFK